MVLMHSWQVSLILVYNFIAPNVEVTPDNFRTAVQPAVKDTFSAPAIVIERCLSPSTPLLARQKKIYIKNPTLQSGPLAANTKYVLSF